MKSNPSTVDGWRLMCIKFRLVFILFKKREYLKIIDICLFNGDDLFIIVLEREFEREKIENVFDNYFFFLKM